MNTKKLWNIALALAIITVFYNIAEGLLSIYLGFSDESLTLFGFGLDSFIEVMSGMGIWHMILRIKKTKDDGQIDSFEKNALRITGISFYILTAALLLTVLFNVYNGHKPSTTFWGIIISLISIVTMIALMRTKQIIGKKLSSDAIIADANCTKTCLYLSVILLISSGLYAVFQIGYIDSIGALGIAYYSFLEGRESFEKAKGKTCSCSSCHG